jgi:cob(I)alamin adenosyltransferase
VRGVGGPRQHRGDGGETGLGGGGARVSKDDARIACVGAIDELSSFLGLAAAMVEPHAPLAAVFASVQRIQRELYVLGAQLGRRADVSGPSLGADHVATLDAEVDAFDAALPKLTAFILPAGGPAASALHVARAVCRRAEREVVHLSSREPVGPHVIPYLNRLSLLLFSLARTTAHALGRQDEPANPQSA